MALQRRVKFPDAVPDCGALHGSTRGTRRNLVRRRRGIGYSRNGYPNTGDVGGTPYTHPQYDPAAFFLYDLGVVVLDEPVVMDEYGSLPTEDQLDALARRRGKQDVTFTAVGYGLQQSFPDAAS